MTYALKDIIVFNSHPRLRHALLLISCLMKAPKLHQNAFCVLQAPTVDLLDLPMMLPSALRAISVQLDQPHLLLLAACKITTAQQELIP